MTVYAGIVAGGNGSRMGGPLPKQYIPIGGVPIIVHTVRAVSKFADVVYIACPESYMDYTMSLISTHAALANVKVIAGGETRMQSVSRILQCISSTPDDIIITHDGVRPFVSERIVTENISLAKKFLACGTFIPAVDTLCESDDGVVLSNVPDRSRMYNVQTPQTFNVNILKEMFAACSDNLEQFTDLCGLAVHCGMNVHMVTGEKSNIKITTPVDVTIAEAILKGGA